MKTIFFFLVFSIPLQFDSEILEIYHRIIYSGMKDILPFYILIPLTSKICDRHNSLNFQYEEKKKIFGRYFSLLQKISTRVINSKII